MYKKFILIIITILIALNISCEGGNSNLVENITTTETTTNTIDTFDYSSLARLCPQENLSQDIKSVEWSSSMVFTDINSAEEYLTECILNCQEIIGIIIPNGYEVIKQDYYRNIGDVWRMRGTQTKISNGKEKATFIVFNPEYTTGKLVYNAYRTNDTSKLTDIQLKVYHMAKYFIENILDTSKSILEQEKQIYDYICNITTYYNSSDISSNEYVNYKSAIGVFIDGLANCMGYSDAFYMLCSMAGMEVITTIEDIMNHCWNIITLDNKKYLVDLTYADTIYQDLNIISYEYFNAPLEFVSQQYSLSKDSITLSITQHFDKNSYFLADEFNSNYVTKDSIYTKIVSSIERGERSIEILCIGELSTTDETQFSNQLLDIIPSSLNIDTLYCTINQFDNFNYILVYF